ncbi:MAG: hypothetical protein GF320_09340 [Armatimonadia bacterium]|nr:hypothetical protein [Armatimonadia bacterium]
MRAIQCIECAAVVVAIAWLSLGPARGAVVLSCSPTERELVPREPIVCVMELRNDAVHDVAVVPPYFGTAVGPAWPIDEIDVRDSQGQRMRVGPPDYDHPYAPIRQGRGFNGPYIGRAAATPVQPWLIPAGSTIHTAFDLGIWWPDLPIGTYRIRLHYNPDPRLLNHPEGPAAGLPLHAGPDVSLWLEDQVLDLGEIRVVEPEGRTAEAYERLRSHDHARFAWPQGLTDVLWLEERDAVAEHFGGTAYQVHLEYYQLWYDADLARKGWSSGPWPPIQEAAPDRVAGFMERHGTYPLAYRLPVMPHVAQAIAEWNALGPPAGPGTAPVRELFDAAREAAAETGDPAMVAWVAERSAGRPWPFP